MDDTLPILLAVLYHMHSELHARLTLKAEADERLDLTVIHEGMHTVSAQDLSGVDESDVIEVIDRESITIIARRQSIIVASGVYEVNCSADDEQRYLLIPRCTHNILLTQAQQSDLPASLTFTGSVVEAVQS